MSHMNRRDLLRQVTALSAAAAVTRRDSMIQAQTQNVGSATPADTTRFFPGFKAFRVQTTGATITGVVGGQGPPVLLLHGAPQSHITWRLVAPKLAADYTVVVADLRGYGDSSKPADGDEHVNYSKRAMALDQ